MPRDCSNSTERTEPAPASFQAEQWKYILTLLGLIIVADRKTLKEEIDTFLRSVKELRAVIDPTICLTEQMARDWFVLNKPALEDVISTLSYDTAICETVAPIKSMPHKLDVISYMVKIAVSDGEYCQVEKDLIEKTCRYWNVRSNFQQNLEAIHEPDVRPKLVEGLKSLPKYNDLVETYGLG